MYRQSIPYFIFPVILHCYISNEIRVFRLHEVFFFLQYSMLYEINFSSFMAKIYFMM